MDTSTNDNVGCQRMFKIEPKSDIAKKRYMRLILERLQYQVTPGKTLLYPQAADGSTHQGGPPLSIFATCRLSGAHKAADHL